MHGRLHETGERAVIFTCWFLGQVTLNHTFMGGYAINLYNNPPIRAWFKVIEWTGPTPLKFDRKIHSSSLQSYCHVTLSHVLSAPSMSPTDNYLQMENTTNWSYSLDGVPIQHCMNPCTGSDSRL